MNYNKIAVLHLNQIGDLVFSLPLLKALRENFPTADVHSIVKPYLRELLAGSPYVDDVLIRAGGLKAKYDLAAQVRRNRYDLIISLARSEECLTLAALSGASVKAGFSHFPWDFSLDIKEKIVGHNSWFNNAKLLQQLKVTVTKNDYVGLLTAGEDCSLPELPERFVVVSPGASARRLTKTWDEKKFAELMILLKERFDLSGVLVGSKDNRERNREIIGYMGESGRHMDVRDLSGEIGLRTLCAVLKKARLFVGIDSGVMHLAAALDIPVVGLFGPTDPAFVGPQNSRSLVVRQEQLECVPCYLKDCGHRQCMQSLEVSKVLQACEQLMTCRF